jgi:hypothetical protein
MISISKEAVEYNTKQTTKDKSQQENGTQKQRNDIGRIFSSMANVCIINGRIQRF